MLKAVNDTVIVEKLGSPGMTASGLHIPPSAQVNSNLGKVIDVPAKIYYQNGAFGPAPCKPGDLILFKTWGDTVKVDGKEVLLLKSHEVLCVVVNDTATPQEMLAGLDKDAVKEN